MIKREEISALRLLKKKRVLRVITTDKDVLSTNNETATRARITVCD